MQTKILIIFLISCSACNNTDKVHPDKKLLSSETMMAFDKEKWQSKQGKDYPYRDKMLEAIFANDTIRKLDKDKVIALLGQPDRIDSLYLFFTVAQKRAAFFPLHTKTLVIKISDDSTHNKIMIHE